MYSSEFERCSCFCTSALCFRVTPNTNDRTETRKKQPKMTHEKPIRTNNKMHSITRISISTTSQVILVAATVMSVALAAPQMTSSHINRLTQLGAVANNLPAAPIFQQQQQQPTVIQPSARLAQQQQFTGSQYQQYQQQQQQQQHRYNPNVPYQQYRVAHSYVASGGNQMYLPPGSNLSHSVEPLRMCQLSEPMMQMTKCKAHQEEDFKRTARAEFQEKLRETSAELGLLLGSHLKEFRAVSLSLISFAESETMLKMQHSSSHRLSSSSSELSNQLDATRQLFRALAKHLQNYQTFSAGSTYAQQVRYSYSSVADINQEIGYYFKRLHLIQVKRVLEHKQQVALNLDCLDANLPTQQHVEAILGELVAESSSAPVAEDSNANHTSSISSEQMKLTLSIKQSLEFARTLLSSLSLANDMFRNITERVDDWMPNEQCHRALARMTVCQQCHPSSSSSSSSSHHQQQQQVSGSLRRWVPLASSSSSSTPFGGADSPPAAPMRLVASSASATGASAFVAAPCENYCLNVVGGCMSDLYELNRIWSEHVSALSRFKTNMIQMNNIESVMSSLADRLLAFTGRLRQQYNNAIEQQRNANVNDNDATIRTSDESASTKSSNSKPMLLKSTEVSSTQAIAAAPAE